MILISSAFSSLPPPPMHIMFPLCGVVFLRKRQGLKYHKGRSLALKYCQQKLNTVIFNHFLKTLLCRCPSLLWGSILAGTAKLMFCSWQETVGYCEHKLSALLLLLHPRNFKDAAILFPIFPWVWLNSTVQKCSLRRLATASPALQASIGLAF